MDMEFSKLIEDVLKDQDMSNDKAESFLLCSIAANELALALATGAGAYELYKALKPHEWDLRSESEIEKTSLRRKPYWWWHWHKVFIAEESLIRIMQRSILKEVVLALMFLGYIEKYPHGFDDSDNGGKAY